MSSYVDTRLINLNSNYASTYYNDTFLSNLSFKFNSLLKNDDDILSVTIGILNAQIPVSFYIINEYNNVLNFIHNNNIYSITVSIGNYNALSLSTELISKLNSVTNSTWSIVLNKSNGIFTFINALSFTLQAISTISPIIGLDIIDSVAIYLNNNYTLQCPYLVNLLGIKKLKILSNNLASYNVDSTFGGACSLVGTVPVNQPPFSLIQYQNNGNLSGNLRSKVIDEIDIQIYDEFNNLVDFNNISWTITLELSIVRKLKENINDFPTSDILQTPENPNPETNLKNNIDSTNNLEDPNLTQPTFINEDNLPIDPSINNDLDLLLYNN